MSIKTGLRRAVVASALSGVAFALPAGVASASPLDDDVVIYCTTDTGEASDLSPSTQKAWADFTCGGGELAGGLAKMVSGAWVGWAGLAANGAMGTPASPEQLAAWQNWDTGGHQAGEGAAMMVSGAYVGGPGYIVDKIKDGAAPSDLSADELDQLSFSPVS